LEQKAFTQVGVKLVLASVQIFDDLQNPFEAGRPRNRRVLRRVQTFPALISGARPFL
jgi:hypothetical protein